MGLMASLTLPVFAQGPTTRTAHDSDIPRTFIGYSYNSGYNTYPVRDKDNNSYIYIYLLNNSGFNLWVVAKSGSGANCMRNGNGHAIVPTGQYFVTNFVRERGYTNCYLNLTTAQSGTSGYVQGAWSPDSVGSYPIAG